MSWSQYDLRNNNTIAQRSHKGYLFRSSSTATTVPTSAGNSNFSPSCFCPSFCELVKYFRLVVIDAVPTQQGEGTAQGIPQGSFPLGLRKHTKALWGGKHFMVLKRGGGSACCSGTSLERCPWGAPNNGRGHHSTFNVRMQNIVRNKMKMLEKNITYPSFFLNLLPLERGQTYRHWQPAASSLAHLPRRSRQLCPRGRTLLPHYRS